MLYYDSVELPESPESWYSLIDPMEMRGWVALGNYLSTRHEMGSGLDLVVLDSICDRTGLIRKTVHTMLKQFADPRKMVYSQIALAVQHANRNGSTLLQALECVQAKLQELCKLAIRIKPTEGSIFQTDHGTTQRRIQGYLHTVVGPRVKSLGSGTPLNTAAKVKHLNKKNMEGIKLNYYFQATQQQRAVPLARYGVLPRSVPRSLGSPPTSPIDMETEQATHHAQELTTSNQALQAQLADLQRRNEKLLQTNESMARKITTIDHFQPVGYVHVNQSSSTEHWRTSSTPLEQDVSTAPTQKSHANEPIKNPFHALPQTPPHISLQAVDPPTQQPAQPKELPDKYATMLDTVITTSPPTLHLVNPARSAEAAAHPPNTVPRRGGSNFTLGLGLNDIFETL
ncbi:hypothetical protein J1614_005302 [Plenodomus biglobosus]|nr:hypothetical protein J1614_005302 [Plenodomus biglobosus]